MNDSDDSIVLDDLVRTAEASRLRRRGAMRIDHNHYHYQHHHNGNYAMDPMPVISWDDDSDRLEEEYQNPTPRRSTTTRTSLRQRDEQPEYSYSLFCGGELSDSSNSSSVSTDASTPYKPSILPVIPSPRRSAQIEKKRRPLNGCGTLLHTSAAPRRKSSSSTSSSSSNTYTWHAPYHGASHDVVPIDPSYVEDPNSLRIHRAPCGCVREPVACAACGNVLGTRFMSCPASCPAHVRSSHRTEELRRLQDQSCTYTFLANAVSSSPVYVPTTPGGQSLQTTAPASSSSFQQSTQSQSPQSPRPTSMTPSYPPLLDRLITASPTPLSDEERAAYRARPAPAVQPRYSYGFSPSFSGYWPPTPSTWYPSGYVGRNSSLTLPLGGGVYDADGEFVDLDRWRERQWGREDDHDLGSSDRDKSEGGHVLVPER